MNIKAVLFDLDGTLLPMDYDGFIKTYFKGLAAHLAPRGYEPQKLVDAIWTGTAAMIKNNGSCTNEEAFWKKFVEIYGEEAMQDKPCIDAFYSGEFSKVKSVCGYTVEAAEVVNMLKEMGKTVVLATNPIFPAVATRARIDWAGLKPEDFAFYTTYENSTCCKPNPQYYLDILEKIGFKPEECLMVGNDAEEDMFAAASVGMEVFLLTDCLLNKKELDISVYPQGGFEELKAFLRA